MARARIGVIGCGKVSHMYLPNLTTMSGLEVAAVTDLDREAAKQVAEQYSVPKVMDYEELLEDASIKLVLNLTPIAVHVQTTRDALAAGKHVYSEKPLATNVAEAQSLLQEAQRRGLTLACAPDTLLGTGFQAAHEALHAGRIGRPLAASAAMFRSALTSPSFYTVGSTAFFDMAPYYVSALVALFGPATKVTGTTRTWLDNEPPPEPTAGATIAVAGTVEFSSGLFASLTLAWGTTHRQEVPAFTVHGTTGVLHVPNPNNFGDPAFVEGYGQERLELADSRQPDSWRHNLRGLGVAEHALAVQEDRQPRASADLACHVVDVISALEHAGSTGERVTLTTTCTPPEPLTARTRQQLLG